MNSNSVNFLSCSPKFAKDLVVQHSERQGGSLHPHPSTPHDAYHLLRGHCACLSSDRLRWLCNPLRHGPHSAHASLSVCALRHMQIFRQKGGRLRASVAASPWVLLRVGGGTGISEVVRLRVCGFVCARLCVGAWLCMRVAGFRLQLPPNSHRHHQALFLPPPPSCPPRSLIPKVNLFTVILKGELFAVIVRTDEGQALRGGPACP